jgi:hypothetical protein
MEEDSVVMGREAVSVDGAPLNEALLPLSFGCTTTVGVVALSPKPLEPLPEELYVACVGSVGMLTSTCRGSSIGVAFTLSTLSAVEGADVDWSIVEDTAGSPASL